MSVVLITGCSTGIGFETALAFARRGDTTVASMRDLRKAEVLSARAKAEGLALDLIELDVCDDRSVARAVANVVSRHGAVDVLVNNAGIGGQAPIESTDLDFAHKQMETNFWGPLRMIQAVLPAMRARRKGVIVNVSSVSGRLPGIAYNALYAATKHALGVLSESLRMEVAHRGVRVVCIEPGFFQTAIVDNAPRSVSPDSPYAADFAWVLRFFAESAAVGGNAAVVADAIVAGAYDAKTPLHVLVGDDAKATLDLAVAAGTAEAWHESAQVRIEGVAGPRPAD
jgi:NAD(P)-dependent dehydrogenase (short-subunit alcohol dehydrogenase family)